MSATGGGLLGALRELRRAAGWHRRLLAAGLAAAAVAFGLDALAPAPPPSAGVVVAARDLPAGARLRAQDVALRRLPPSAVPGGATASPPVLVGRVVAAAVRRGEPLTDVRLVGRALLDALPAGHVAAPVRIADAAAATLLRAGDIVDLVAARPAEAVGADATGAVVAAAARVLTVQPGDAGVGEGGLVVVDVEAGTAVELARAAVSARLSVVLRPITAG